MLVAETCLGHRDDEAVAARLDGADPYRVVLSDTERRRSRVRTETESGRDLGIVVADELADGDVLETENGDLVVVDLAAVEALVVDFADASVPATRALEVGHALGNRHWDLAVRGEAALFPVADTRERTVATVADLLPDGVETRFETVSPATFDDATPDHDHGDHSHGGDGHAHGGSRGHSHAHGGESGHGHGDGAGGHSHGEGDDPHPHTRGVRTIGGDDDG